MENQVREFFAINRVIILSVYGQTFFVLGLAIALQSWSHSRLALARTLPWLAAFGFAHGLHEWGYLFIPIQATYLSRPIVEFLTILQAILLAVSFTLLFQFGLETLRPLPGRKRFLRYLPLALMVLWLWYSFGIASRIVHDVSAWNTWIGDWARYMIGFPGAAVAAYGLYRQRQALEQTWHPPKSISRSLNMASLTLLGYAIFGGLIVLPADFFPANRVNSDLIYALTRWPVELWRSLLGLALAISIIRALELFRLEIDRRLDDMEEQQVLLSERDRIGRELHDGTLQSIYATGLLLRTAEREVGQTGSDVGLSRIQESIQLLDRAIADIRDYIGTLRAQPTVQSLKVGIQELIRESPIRSLVDVETRLAVPDDRKLSPVQVGHLLTITNEALSNVVRHAHAKHVSVVATATDACLCVEIKDDGHGMPSDYVIGYGLRNMQERARLLGGALSITSHPKRGTTVRVEMPWIDANETSSITVS